MASILKGTVVTESLVKEILATHNPKDSVPEGEFENRALYEYEQYRARRQAQLMRTNMPENRRMEAFSAVAVEQPSRELIDAIIGEIKLRQLDELL